VRVRHFWPLAAGILGEKSWHVKTPLRLSAQELRGGARIAGLVAFGTHRFADLATKLGRNAQAEGGVKSVVGRPVGVDK
jgi:hypothetical protein